MGLNLREIIYGIEIEDQRKTNVNIMYKYKLNAFTLKVINFMSNFTN